MYNFCTYFNKNYILRGLTLFRSLEKHLNNFHLFVLCLDEYTFQLIKKIRIDNLVPVALKDIENHFPELIAVKPARTLIEYYFTLTPVLPLYLLQQNPLMESITYLDADLFFYSSPEPIYSEFKGESILITPHRFPHQLKSLERFGLYNVQLIVFRNDIQGKLCLENYKQQCLGWCHDYPVSDRYADQKYLDAWPQKYPVKILENKGAGLAPWNWMQYQIRIDPKNGTTLIDDDKLIFYHFHGLKILLPCLINHGLSYYKNLMPPDLGNFFYKNYLQQLKTTDSWIEQRTGFKGHFFYADSRFRTTFLRQILVGLYRKNLMWIC